MAVEEARTTTRKKKRKRSNGAVVAVDGGVELFDFISRFLLEEDAAARDGDNIERSKKGSLSGTHDLFERRAGESGAPSRVNEENVLEPAFFFFFVVFFSAHSFLRLRSAERALSLSLSLALPGMASPAAAGALASSSSSLSPSSRNAKRSSRAAAANYPLSIISSSSLESLPVPFLLVAALVASSLAPLAARSLARLARLLRRAIDWVFDEFEPWLKWTILDACLALCVGLAARKVRAARPALRALGWL